MAIIGQGKCIFAANGEDLKISSINKPMFTMKSGQCELKELKPGCYQWVVSDSKIKEKKRQFKFKVTKAVTITSCSRDGGQFTIVIKDHADTTQLIGKLRNRNECTILMNTMEKIKNPPKEGSWICAKENTSKTIDSKENSCPQSNSKSPMTRVMDRNINTSSPLQDKSPVKSLGIRLSQKNEIGTTKTLERTPLGDKQGPLQKNKTQTRLFPPSIDFEKKQNEVPEDSEGDVTITAIGGSKTPSSFYKASEKVKIRTYARTKSYGYDDSAKTSWSFREREDLFRPPKDGNETMPVVGFSNLGNTCYMNSILQCLLNIPTFFQDLNNQENLELVQHNSLYNCLCNLGILKYSYETLEHQKYALKRVKSAISSAADRFSGYAQHDAHELLCQCLDQLKEDLYNETKNKYESEALEAKIKELKEIGCPNCPIKSNFESTILHSITCESCGEKVLKEEACHDFSLVIPESDENTIPANQTIEDLLKMYFDHEMIEYSCEKCQGSYSVLSHHFSKLPRVLIIHIKRYDMNDLKKSDRISIPKSINLAAHVNSTTKSIPKFVYDKEKLKAKFDSSIQKTVGSAEKRKSPDILDLEPLQKHSKCSEKECDSEVKDLKEEHALTDACNNNKTNGEVEIDDIDDEKLSRALNESKKDFEDKYTQVQNANPNEDAVSVSNTDGDTRRTIEISSDEHEENGAIGIFDSTIDDEEEQLKRALDLSMQEYEKSQIESFREFEQPVTSNNTEVSINNTINDCDNVDNLYTLVGIVNHHGQNTATGHYTSDSYDFKSKKWRSYNDSSVKEVREYEVRFGRLTSAYIVFYMHNQCYKVISDA